MRPVRGRPQRICVRTVRRTRLPLGVTVLEEIATDPLVGTPTSPELNDAGKDLKGFSQDK